MNFALIQDKTVCFETISSDTKLLSQVCTYNIPVCMDYSAAECEHKRCVSEAIANSLFHPSTRDGPRFFVTAKLNLHMMHPCDISIEIKSVTDNRQPCIFQRLKSVFNEDNIDLHMDLRLLYGPIAKLSVKGEDLTTDFENGSLRCDKISIVERDHVVQAEVTKALLTLVVQVNFSAMQELIFQGYNKKSYTEQLWTSMLSHDLVLTTEAGEELKGHKCILLTCSQAFQNLIEPITEENPVSRLKLKKMSKDGIHAFLEFVYCQDLKAATESCDIALELYQAAHKYEVRELQNAVKRTICTKEFDMEWFNVNMVVQLAKFVHRKNAGIDLLKTIARVVKWYARNAPEKLLNSREFEDLIKGDSLVTMWLISNLIALS